MHKKDFRYKGKPLTKDSKVLVMLHGRGASAEDILTLADHLNVADFTLVAPQATNHTWYPYSFLAPPKQNEPWLSSALELLNGLMDDLYKEGVRAENVYFLGFSQGACLSLEFAARNAGRYGGIVAYTGGLIGDKIYSDNYKGDFAGTPVFIGSSNPDMHVPVERVHETTAILKSMNADVAEKIYNNMGHTIIMDEIESANKLIFDKSGLKHV